jgi:hypothetical protein
MKKILSILPTILLLVPLSARAQLVPCGGEDNPCQLCHLFVLLDNVLDFIFLDFVPPIAIIAVVIGGIYFFTAGGDPAKVGKAKTVLTTVAVGLLIIYGSWLLISSFFLAIGVSEWTGLWGAEEGNRWFKYPCD